MVPPPVVSSTRNENTRQNFALDLAEKNEPGRRLAMCKCRSGMRRSELHSFCTSSTSSSFEEARKRGRLRVHVCTLSQPAQLIPPGWDRSIRQEYCSCHSLAECLSATRSSRCRSKLLCTGNQRHQPSGTTLNWLSGTEYHYVREHHRVGDRGVRCIDRSRAVPNSRRRKGLLGPVATSLPTYLLSNPATVFVTPRASQCDPRRG
ncbi:hypothetical protein V8F20_002740 [Naviculisporaceae sp. PSN 640]